MKLISSKDFGKTLSNETDVEYRRKRDLYDKFIEQPLKLEMLIPCDEDSNYWKYPPTQDEWEWAKKDSTEAEQSFKQKEFYYQKAKEKVLFENFTVLSDEDGIIELECKDIFINYNKEEDLFFLDSWNGDALIMNIECLANLINHTASNIELTENATKQFK